MPQDIPPEKSLYLETIVHAVLASPKYHAISSQFIQRLARQEYERGQNIQDAVKAVKKKLHQVAGAYLERKPHYPAWLAELTSASQSRDPMELKQVCRRIMHAHASTRERLLFLDPFYARIGASLPPIRSILDIACGLNPLAIPWMNLAEHVEYYAVDIYDDMVDFINKALMIFNVKGFARSTDVVESIPDLGKSVDVAFILKTIPCLEQIEKNAGARLLEVVRARNLIVSFPVHSLSGKRKGMLVTYENRFNDLVSGKSWPIQRFEFPTELVFLVKKEP